VEAAGIEHPAKSLGKSPVDAKNVSLSGAVEIWTPKTQSWNDPYDSSQNCQQDALNASRRHPLTMTNLDRVVQSWPLLPPHIQEAILALVDATHPDLKGWVSKPVPSVHGTTTHGSKNSQSNRATISSTILKVLRHTPELFSLEMDFDGWVRESEFRNFIAQLLKNNDSLQGMPIVEILRNLELSDRVQTRLGFVRAAYGHSTHRFAPTTSAIPDQPLYHGTSAHNWPIIECFGLSAINRRFVQLTTDFDYASQIARSHGRSPIVLQVAMSQAIESAVRFYPTGAHVWQATTIPSICLQVWMDDAFELDEPLF
jgi:putative RNA 2'-phosphotransferase